MKMTSRILAAVSLLALTTAASASDLESMPNGVDWTGIRLGVQAGYGWGRVHDITPIIAAAPGSFLSPNRVKVDGFLGGGSIGYNFDLGDFVVGVEGDGEFSDVNGRATMTATAPGFGVIAGNNVRVNGNWLASIRGRIGWNPMDDTLVYATVGYEWHDVDVRFAQGGQFDKFNITYSGLTVGGGVEHRFMDRFSVRVEYRYSNYGKERVQTVGNTLGGNPFLIDSQMDLHAIRVGGGFTF